MNNIKDLPYRLGVGMMVFNKDNMVFVGKRIDTKSEAWQMPQGGIDEGEVEDAAALRELEEEIGSDKFQIIKISDDYYYYDLPEKIVPKVWKGKYRGQKQKWFALRFLGDDNDINIHVKNAEFCEWKWIKTEDLLGSIVEFKREIYSKIIDEFGNVKW